MMVPRAGPGVTGPGVPTEVGASGPGARDASRCTVLPVAPTATTDQRGTPVTTTHVDSTASTLRPPLPVRAAALVLVPLALVSTAGLILFTFVRVEGPVGPGAVFAAFVLATTASALAALPGLLRGRLEAWAVVTTWSCCYTYWSVYKVFGEREYESVGFLAAGVVLIALLTSRGARAFAGAAR